MDLGILLNTIAYSKKSNVAIKFYTSHFPEVISITCTKYAESFWAFKLKCQVKAEYKCLENVNKNFLLLYIAIHSILSNENI